MSIPRAARGNNYNNITEPELSVFYDKVNNVLRKHISVVNPLNLILRYFEVDRCDLFFMHTVPPYLKEEYLNAYSKLHLGRFVDEQHGDTSYYMSSKYHYNKKNRASVVAVFYDKEQEMYQKEQPELFNTFETIQGELLHNQQPSTVRIEIRLMRNKLRRLFNSKSVTLQDILAPAFQRGVLNSYFERFRLYDEILSKTEFYKWAELICKTPKTLANMIDFIDSVRAKSPPNLTPYVLQYLKEILHNNQIHYVTTPRHSLAPLDVNALTGSGGSHDFIGEAINGAIQYVLENGIFSDIDVPLMRAL